MFARICFLFQRTNIFLTLNNAKDYGEVRLQEALLII